MDGREKAPASLPAPQQAASRAYHPFGKGTADCRYLVEIRSRIWGHRNLFGGYVSTTASRNAERFWLGLGVEGEAKVVDWAVMMSRYDHYNS